MLPGIRALLQTYFQHVAAYQASALLTVVYVTVVAASAAFLRLTGRRLLPTSPGGAESHWLSRPPTARDLRTLSKQF